MTLDELHHAFHSTHAAHSSHAAHAAHPSATHAVVVVVVAAWSSSDFLGNFGDEGFGGEQQGGDAGRVLQSGT